VLSSRRRVRLSKLVAFVLRHRPERFGLRLDAEGFVPLADLLAAIPDATEDEIHEVVAASEKPRFEVVGDRIRARYGHSVSQPIAHPEVEPPERLYHGTAARSLPDIRRGGLRPMRRQYVHLSTDRTQALVVGRRHDPAPVVLVVRAREAWQAGVRFFRPAAPLYLAHAIPPEFIDLE